MEKSNSKKAKVKKATRSKKQPTLVVAFPDYINYGEVAAILTEKTTKLCVDSKQMSFAMTEDGFDYYEFASVLEEFIDNDMLNELMETEFGQGILVGIYLMRAAELRTQAEVEILEGLEDL